MSGNTSQFDEHLVDTTVLESRIARSRTVPEFTMQAVSTETGIPANTLRSWERRYGFPNPSRDDSGRRIYAERDIVALSWLRSQTGRGQGVSEAIAMLRGILDATNRSPAPPAAPSLSPVTTLTDALLAGDLASAQQSWDRISLSVSPEGLIEHVLLPAHRRVSSAELPLSVRGSGTAFLLRKSIVLFDAASPDTGARSVAILIQGGAGTSIPAYALATILARNGYRVHGSIGNLGDATTFVALRDIAPGTPVIVVTDHHDPDLIDTTGAIVGTANIHVWWPYPVPGPANERALPASLGEVQAYLDDRA